VHMCVIEPLVVLNAQLIFASTQRWRRAEWRKIHGSPTEAPSLMAVDVAVACARTMSRLLISL